MYLRSYIERVVEEHLHVVAADPPLLAEYIRVLAAVIDEALLDLVVRRVGEARVVLRPVVQCSSVVVCVVQ